MFLSLVKLLKLFIRSYMSKKNLFSLMSLSFFVLIGCAGYHTVEHPMNFPQKTFAFYEGEQKLILNAICQESRCFFSLVDSLGAPIVSRIYQDGHFSNTKFLPPNSKYDNLFFQIIQNPRLQSYRYNNLSAELICE